MRPNFIGIGAQKCATTWLHDILLDHPEVCLGSKKEIDFFSHHFGNGFQWYERHFYCAGTPVAIGEVSPSYFHTLEAPERTFSYDPAMRLILLLREPLQRALSNHKHEIKIGHLSGPDLSFEFGMLNNPSYVEQGRYATHLERWLQYFPKAQLLVLLFDDIVADPAAAAKTMYGFLGIDDKHVSAALTRRSNEGYVNRFQTLENLRVNLQKALGALSMRWAWQAAALAGGRRLYRTINRASSELAIPPMADTTRQRLKAEFRGEIQRLEQLLGRSLGHWL